MRQLSNSGHGPGRRTSLATILLLAVFASMTVSCDRHSASGGSSISDTSKWLDAEFLNNQERYAMDPDMLVQRGLLADRKHRYIDVLATATGAGPDSTLYALIAAGGEGSSAAIAVTAVKPDDVQSALEFIGMRAGHPLDGSRTHHWPKGERVSITVYWGEPEAGLFNRSLRAEELITDVHWNTTLPALGFRFVGVPEGRSAEAIATLFNATNTVLEVPYIVDRKSIQGQLVANEEYRFSQGQKLRIRIRPEFRGDRRRVQNLVLDIQAGVDVEQLNNLRVKLSTPADEVRVDGNFESTFVYLKTLIDDGKEPFLQLRFADSLAVGSVRMIARFVQSFLIAQDIRIEPNPPQIFYSAFLPRDVWRDPDRRGRSSQPVEIHLERTGSDGLGGEIIQYPLAAEASATIKRIRFGNIKELGEAIERGEPWQTDGVFLFADPSAPYREIRQVYELVFTLFPNLYVFM